jgi:hypothetical protein
MVHAGFYALKPARMRFRSKNFWEQAESLVEKTATALEMLDLEQQLAVCFAHHQGISSNGITSGFKILGL